MNEELLRAAFKRLDNDAQFHFIGCLCEMRIDGVANLDALIETLCDDVFQCPCIWPDKKTLQFELNLACAEKYFEVRS